MAEKEHSTHRYDCSLSQVGLGKMGWGWDGGRAGGGLT